MGNKESVIRAFGFDIEEGDWAGKFRAVPDAESMDTFQNSQMKYFKLKEESDPIDPIDPQPCLMSQAKYATDPDMLAKTTCQGTVLPDEFAGWGDYCAYVLYNEKVQRDYMKETGATAQLFWDVKDEAGDSLEGEWTLWVKGKIVACQPSNEPRPSKIGWWSPQDLGDDAPLRTKIDLKLHSHKHDPDLHKYDPANHVLGKGQDGTHRDHADEIAGHVRHAAHSEVVPNDYQDSDPTNTDAPQQDAPAITTATHKLPTEEDVVETSSKDTIEVVADLNVSKEADYNEGNGNDNDNDNDNDNADDVVVVGDVSKEADYSEGNENDNDNDNADDDVIVVDVTNETKEADYSEGDGNDGMTVSFAVDTDANANNTTHDTSGGDDDVDEEELIPVDEENTGALDYSEGNLGEETKESDYTEGNLDATEVEADYTDAQL